MSQAKRIVLAARPVGEPKPSDFRIEEFAVPAPAAGDGGPDNAGRLLRVRATRGSQAVIGSRVRRPRGEACHR